MSVACSSLTGSWAIAASTRDFLAVGHLDLVLERRVGRVVDAAVDVGIAAQDVGLFDDDHALRAVLQRGDRRGQTRAAAADHDHVGLDLIGLAGHFLGRRLEGLHVDARLGQRVLHGLLDAVGGEGCAGQAVHRDELGFDDPPGHLRHGDRSDVVGLRVAGDGHVGDFAILNGDIHVDIAVAPEGRAVVDIALSEGSRDQQHCEQYRNQCNVRRKD